MEQLLDLLGIDAPSGGERELADYVAKVAAPFADEIKWDALGNLFILKKGKRSAAPLMLLTGLDERGFLITRVEADGRLRFAPLGDWDIPSLLGARVTVGDRQGVLWGKATGEMLELSDCTIDIGMTDGEEAQEMAAPGKAVTLAPNAAWAGPCLCSKGLGAKAGVYLLLKALQEAGVPATDTWFVFCVQDQLGGRGARTAAFGISPSACVVVDACPADREGSEASLGEGVAVSTAGKSALCHPAMTARLVELAQGGEIPFSIQVMGGSGITAGQIQTAGTGVPVGRLSLPLRYGATPSEMAHKDDVEACARLLTAVVREGIPLYYSEQGQSLC